MKEILTADQMRRSDQRMIQKMQVPSLVLMERAALQCVAAMKAEDIDLSKALVVCGSGNNGAVAHHSCYDCSGTGRGTCRRSSL